MEDIKEKDECVNNDKNKHCFSIDYLMLPCKITSYLMYSSIGCITRFANIFLVSIGLNASEAGFISGSCFLVSAIAGPCWGLIADKTGCRRLIFIILCLSLAGSGFSWPWIARSIGSSDGTLTNCSSPIPIYLHNTSVANTSDDIELGSYKCTKIMIPFKNPLFYSMFAISILTYLCLYPTEGILNSMINNIIHSNPTNQGYGQQRMFGAIGIGSANFIAGFAADKFEHPTLSKYTAVYIIFLPFILLVIPMSLVLFRRTSWARETKNNEHTLENEESENTSILENSKDGIDSNQKSRLKILLKIFSKLDNIIVMSTVLFVGAVRTVTLSFLYLIIKDEMNGSRTSMGLCMVMNSFASASMFYFTQKLIKFFGGPIVCVELSLISWIIRLILMAYINNPWVMALPQVLQCFGFALFWSAMVQYVQQISSKEVYITLFTILSAIQYGGGGFLVNVIGGKLYDVYRGPALCIYTAIASCVWLVMVFTYFHGITYVKKCFKKEKDGNNTEEVNT